MTRHADRPADRPRRRKKDRADKSRRRYWILGGAIGGAALLALVVAGAAVLGSRPGPAKVAAPEAYSAYDSPEDVFHVSLPAGWKVRSGGRKGTAWVSAEKGAAAIRAQDSLVGSLLGDIAGAAQPDLNVRDELLPVSRVHEQKRGAVAGEYAGYTEEPAETVATGFGKARRSAFAGRAGLSGKVRGYRVTALGAMTQVTVVCTCPPGDWDALEPAFARVIASVGPGPAGR